jgi:hypothetical protein
MGSLRSICGVNRVCAPLREPGIPLSSAQYLPVETLRNDAGLRVKSLRLKGFA